MLQIFKNIISFIIDPKNTRMLLFAGIVIFALLFLRQCGKTADAKAEVELSKIELVRAENNHAASLDSLEQYQFDNNTIRAEKLAYELKLEELEDDYSELLGDFELEKNKPPKTVIKTVYEIRDSIVEVPVYIVEGDSLFDNYLAFSDSANYDSTFTNYRYLSGRIPFNYNFNDSTITPGLGNFDLQLGMNLNLGLFRDKKTKQISIMADTDYPGVIFTRLDGAYIMDDPANRKIFRQMRKQWSLGMSFGYGFMYNYKNNQFVNGPYLGLGLNYQPKFLQW